MRDRRAAGFGFLEILVSIGIVALVIVLSYPGYKRSGLMEKARTVKTDLAQIEAAVTRAAAELKAPAGAWLKFDQYAKYLPPGRSLQRSGLDPFGHPYGPARVGSKPSVPAKVSEALHGLLPEGFWEGFPVGEEL